MYCNCASWVLLWIAFMPPSYLKFHGMDGNDGNAELSSFASVNWQLSHKEEQGEGRGGTKKGAPAPQFTSRCKVAIFFKSSWSQFLSRSLTGSLSYAFSFSECFNFPILFRVHCAASRRIWPCRILQLVIHFRRGKKMREWNSRELGRSDGAESKSREIFARIAIFLKGQFSLSARIAGQIQRTVDGGSKWACYFDMQLAMSMFRNKPP